MLPVTGIHDSCYKTIERHQTRHHYKQKECRQSEICCLLQESSILTERVGEICCLLQGPSILTERVSEICCLLQGPSNPFEKQRTSDKALLQQDESLQSKMIKVRKSL